MKIHRTVCALLFLSIACCGLGQSLSHDIKVRKIWDKAEHCAFTDLMWFKNGYYCTFREGSGHIPGTDGVIRILKSSDGKQWTDLALLKKKGYDLRDPKLSITPDGRIMVMMGGSIYAEEKLMGRTPHVSFSDMSGEHFSAPEKIVIDPEIVSWGDWTWRVTWYEGVGYTMDYQIGPEERQGPTAMYLLRTKDGVSYEKVSKIELDGFPNEATLRFDRTGRMFALIRRDLGDKMGIIAQSEPPYSFWTYTPLNYRLGGPNFLFDGDGRMIAGTRVYEPEIHMGILVGDTSGKLREVLRLPSDNGDTGYPGLILEKDRLMVSYYSSHEGKTAVYMAEIPLDRMNKRKGGVPMGEE